MKTFFPQSTKLKTVTGIESQSFRYGDAEVLLSLIAPGAIVEQHQHPKAQIGMALAGRFEIDVNGRKEILEPFEKAYVADPHVYHGAANHFSEMALGLDLKLFCPVEEYHTRDDAFLSISSEKEFNTGLLVKFIVGPWFEVMISKIPPGGQMSLHSHKNVQIGIALEGKYILVVGDEKQEFEYGKVYFAPPNVPHGAYNPFPEEACSVNIFIPPRYHKVRGHKEMMAKKWI